MRFVIIKIITVIHVQLHQEPVQFSSMVAACLQKTATSMYIGVSQLSQLLLKFNMAAPMPTNFYRNNFLIFTSTLVKLVLFNGLLNKIYPPLGAFCFKLHSLVVIWALNIYREKTSVISFQKKTETYRCSRNNASFF